MANEYATVRMYKDWFDVTSSDHDEVILALLETVSRYIDSHLHRRFYAATETRYFTAADSSTAFINDLLSVTTLKTDSDGDRTYEDTWTTSDYDLCPYNASTDGQPYTWIETAPEGDYTFPSTRKGIEIAGSWGYCAAGSEPQPIQEACLLGAHRLYARHDTALGVSASPNLGQLQTIVRELGTDPDFLAMIAPYKRLTYGPG